MLRRIFGPKRDEVTREWKKLHNEGLNDLYSSPNIIRVIKSRRFWVGKPQVKKPPGRPRRRWVHNIKLNLQAVGWGGGGGLD